ncbi:MAG: hypothetical protein IKH22_00130 [Prevotella sp.]|nr:hypothetical protein [Prevotella sp.]
MPIRVAPQANTPFPPGKTANPAKQERGNTKPKLPKWGAENDGREKQKRQFGETNPLKSLNEINGIVEQIHWNR